MEETVTLISGTIKAEPLLSEERPDDILALVKHCIWIADEQMNTGQKELSREAEEYLLSQNWQGRGKELEILVKRACILSEEPLLHIEDFDTRHGQIGSMGICAFIEKKLKKFMRNIKKLEKFNLYDAVIPEVERALITMVLKETRNNQIQAAKLLGINRNTLRVKIKKLKLSAKNHQK